MKKNFFVKIIAFLSLLLLTLTTFADRWFKVVWENWDSLKLSWDKDDKAVYYQITYWEKPFSERQNSIETEAVDWTNYEIKWLDLSKKYYFTLIGLDSAWNEVFKTEDLEKNPSSSSWSFALKSTSLKEKDNLRLTFSKKLDLTKIGQFDFLIESMDGTKTLLKVVDIKEVEGDDKSIDLFFESDTLDWVDYKLVILAIFDEQGNNIKFWVDSEIKFKWWELNKVNSVEVKNDLNSAWPEWNFLEEKTENKPADKKEEQTVSWSFSWNEVSKENVWKNVETISKNKDNLPKTWPEIILLLILALVAWYFFVSFRNKKS